MTSVPTRPTTTPAPRSRTAPRSRPAPPPEDRVDSPLGTTLVLHWGGPRHNEVDHLPIESLTSAVLVYDGPRWFGVYEQFQPARTQDTPQGPAQVWVVRE
ncbi:hypothetical protein [Blastococcus sp. TBT05-19]|uniref:hypothetical protein n=1 Tax=Blastococcus sp. TBT05-19 TaxID=2250581 RepID=UPI00131423A3|nr:hypothetical protein [Blastococcus sp. TBT05-19]